MKEETQNPDHDNPMDIHLTGMSNGEIVSALKDYFTDEELDSVAGKIDQFVSESKTLDDLIDLIDDYLFEQDA